MFWNIYFNILSRVGVTYKTGSGLDDWIYCTLYIHTTRDYRQYNAIADLLAHTLQFTVTHALEFSSFISRILATDLSVSLSLQIAHGVFFSQPNSSLALILRLPIPKTGLHSIPLLPSSYPGRLASRSSTLHFCLDCCCIHSYNHFAWTPTENSLYC
jgi:hypothetical protein